MPAAYFVCEREVTCGLIETKGPTAEARTLVAARAGQGKPLVSQYRCLRFGTGLEVTHFRGECQVGV